MVTEKETKKPIEINFEKFKGDIPILTREKSVSVQNMLDSFNKMKKGDILSQTFEDSKKANSFMSRIYGYISKKDITIKITLKKRGSTIYVIAE